MDECKPLIVGSEAKKKGRCCALGCLARWDRWTSLGRAVQVDPIKATLKAPGTQRSKLKYDSLLSIFVFTFNLRRCSRGTSA